MNPTLFEVAINKALEKPAPGSIPLSGPRARDNDFYATFLEFPSSAWKFLLASQTPCGYSGWLWEDEREGREATLLKAHLTELTPKLHIEHYFRGYQFDYQSPLGFLLGTAFRRHRLAIVRDHLSQQLYNRRQLARAERNDLLRYFVERTVQNPRASFTPVMLGIELHSRRWFYHPGREEHVAYLRLLMDSMVTTGDLAYDQGIYRVSHKAVATLSEYERDEQRHQDNVRTSRVSNRLTWAIVGVGILAILAQVVMWSLDRAS